MGCASGKAFENPDNIDTSLHQRHQHKSNQSRINGQKSGNKFSFIIHSQIMTNRDGVPWPSNLL